MTQVGLFPSHCSACSYDCAVLPIQHQKDELLAQPQCLGRGFQWPVPSWGRKDPGSGEEGVGAF